MRKSVSRSVLVFAACLVAAQPLTAQDKRGPGGIIDWIHRLSGPSMLGPAASYAWELGEKRARFRFEAAYRIPVARKEKIGDDHKLNMFSLQPSLEVPVFGPAELKSGINIHRFGGKGHAPVWHLSVPLYAQLRIALDKPDNSLFLRIAAGVHYFPAFPYDAFDRGIEVTRRKGEGSFALLGGLDFMR